MRPMRSMLIWLLLDHVRRAGRDAGALADRVGIPPGAREPVSRIDESPPVPIDRAVALAEAAAATLSDPHLGLNLARSVPRGTFGVLEFAIRNAPTLGEAARRLVRYERLNNDALQWTADVDDRSATIGYEVPGMPEGIGRQLDEYVVTTALRFMRELSGAHLVPREARFAHRDASYADPLIEQLGTDRIRLGAGTTALLFSPETWAVRVKDADPTLLAILDEHASMLLPEEDPGASAENLVRHHLRRNLSGAAPRLEDAARALGTTPRNLQRRLAEEGRTYRQVLDDLRQEEARRLLSSTDMPVDEISFLLGYAERRAFVRALSRWTGVTPSEYRARIRER